MRKKSCAPARSLLSSHYLLTPSEVKGALCPLSSLLWENSAHERMRSVAWDKQLSVKCIINLIIEESGDFSPGSQPGDPLSRMWNIWSLPAQAASFLSVNFWMEEEGRKGCTTWQAPSPPDLLFPDYLQCVQKFVTKVMYPFSQPNVDRS